MSAAFDIHIWILESPSEARFVVAPRNTSATSHSSKFQVPLNLLFNMYSRSLRFCRQLARLRPVHASYRPHQRQLTRVSPWANLRMCDPMLLSFERAYSQCSLWTDSYVMIEIGLDTVWMVKNAWSPTAPPGLTLPRLRKTPATTYWSTIDLASEWTQH